MELWKISLVLCAVNFVAAQKNYYGTHIGRLSEYHHSVSGDVFAVDSRTLFIKSFNYDGEGPAAYFYVGNSKTPSNQGAFRIRDETGNPGVLKRYLNKDITLTLPEGKTLRDVKWFSVWCDEFAVDFGNVAIPKNLDFPRPQKINGLRGIHAVSSDNIVIVDAQTLLIPSLSYDGTAPDAKFWVGTGQRPTINGIQIPDENGKMLPLRQYDRKTIVLTLPNHLTVFDIGHFGVWCEAFAVDFGHVRIPDKINVPPSLKMLGISPQSKLNCEVLHDELAFEVRWAVAGESIVIQLVGKLDDNEYMSFGLSPDLKNSVMIGADVVVSWVNRLNGKGYAQDYFLDAKSQCSGNRGSCPDTRLKDNTNSIRLLNAAIVNDYSIVTYQRPLKAADSYDLPILTNQSQAVVWAIGPLNQRFEVSYHSQFLKKNKLIDFGRQPFWNCPIPDSETKPLLAETESTDRVLQQQPPTRKQSNAPARRPPPPSPPSPASTPAPVARPVKATPKSVAKQNNAWEIPPIQCDEPEDGVFYAQMGPTGGKRGYPAITGHVGWGIAWYINGLLIPEINVVRGKTYTFVVEGGNNKSNPANYHPFYITDDPIGGYENKNNVDREQVRIFAGVQKSRANGKIVPNGIGRICNWTPDLKGPPADEYSSFGAYQRSLTLKCEEGDPGIVTFKPDQNTPDTVYYQCFTHRYLGWKINVHDACEQPQASERQEVIVDIEAEPSIRHESKVAPSENFLKQHEKDLIKHHNMNGAPPKISPELTNNTEFRKLIAEGIRTAEALEATLHKQRENSTEPASDGPSKLPPIEIKQSVRKPPFIPPHLIPRPHFSSPQIPIYLRPQIPYRPIKGPLKAPYPLGPQIPMVRQPISFDRRPPPPPRSPPMPHLIPQSSIQINHYKKPVQPQLQSLPAPIKNSLMRGKVPPNAFPKPVLMLGEPTEIKAPYRKSSTDVVVGKPSKTQVDLTPAFGKNKPIRPLIKGGAVNHKQVAEKIPFKEPYNIKNDSTSIEDIAENTGFKAESIVVESGFRPIFKREDMFGVEGEDDGELELPIPARIPSISRRSDVDVDENQFYLSDEAQSFEPVFIPSPEDSAALPLVDSRENETDMMLAEATEKQGVYYLPPNEVKRSAILDPLDLKDPLPSEIQKLSSKTKKFIQDTPQFVPFKGELPLSLQGNFASSSSSSSSPVIRERSSSSISTRLSAVNTSEDT